MPERTKRRVTPAAEAETVFTTRPFSETRHFATLAAPEEVQRRATREPAFALDFTRSRSVGRTGAADVSPAVRHGRPASARCIAAPTSRRPPPSSLLRMVERLVVSAITPRRALIERSGRAADSSASEPATNGAAAEVPLRDW